MVATAPGTATSTAISTLPTRSSLTTSLVSMRALMLRDLVVLKKNLAEFVIRTLVQPFLLCFVFLFVFPKIGQAVGGSSTSGAGESAFATVLVPGVVGISIMFQGVQSVALQMAQEFGFTREIEDRVQAPCPIWLVAMSKVLVRGDPGDHLCDHRAADRFCRPRRTRERHDLTSTGGSSSPSFHSPASRWLLSAFCSGRASNRGTSA